MGRHLKLMTEFGWLDDFYLVKRYAGKDSVVLRAFLIKLVVYVMKRRKLVLCESDDKRAG